MPIVNGSYRKLTEADITDALETELQVAFGEDIDLTESSVFSTLAEVIATTLSDNTEESIQSVYRSAFLETAEGEDLERVVAIVGLQRRAAVHATGVQRFVSSEPVTSDYPIQNGTLVQTNAETPVRFETTETTTLEFIDGFESQSLSNYAGDTGSSAVSFNTTNPYEGSAALEIGATAGTHVYNTNVTIEEGTELRTRIQTGTNGVAVYTFGIQDANNYYQLVIDQSAGEVRIEKVTSGSVSQTIDTNSGLTIPASEYLDVELDWRIDGQMFVTVRDDNEGDVATENATEVATASGSDSAGDSRWRGGYVGFKSGGTNASKLFDNASTSAVSANIRAVNGGSDGNLGASTLTSLPSVPNGVDSTINVFPTGSTKYEDTNGEPFIVGKNEETDAELRARAKESVSSGGDATHDALVNALLNDVEGVSSVTVFENKTDNDNTGTGGLPPHAFEAVVFGGSDSDVASAILDTKAITANDYGGANGTAVSTTVTADSNGQQFTIQFSRPTKLNVDLTTDLVVDDTYVGDGAIKNQIVEYIGGTKSDGTTAVGLGVGDDVYIDQIEDIIVGNDNGVIGFDTSASAEDVTTTPAKTTDSNGLEIVAVGSNEVAQTDASDASITINTTQI